MDIVKELHFSSDAWAIAIPFIFIGLDILTGLIFAWRDKCFSSSKMRDGLAKKIGEIVIIVIGEVLSFGLGLPKYIMNGIIFYIALMEFMSIVENLDKLGVPMPKKLHDVVNANAEDVSKDFTEKESAEDE